MRKKSQGYFSISAVAKMFSVHQQTVRMYEKEGLICPKRSEGNTRLFSEDDIQRLEEIIHFTHTMGINLAGVEMILKLKKQIGKMQREINTLFKEVNTNLDKQVEASKKMVEKSATQLNSLKQRGAQRSTTRRQRIPLPRSRTED